MYLMAPGPGYSAVGPGHGFGSKATRRLAPGMSGLRCPSWARVTAPSHRTHSDEQTQRLRVEPTTLASVVVSTAAAPAEGVSITITTLR